MADRIPLNPGYIQRDPYRGRGIVFQHRWSTRYATVFGRHPEEKKDILVQFFPDFSVYPQGTRTGSGGYFVTLVEPNTGGGLSMVGDINETYDIRLDLGAEYQYTVEDVTNQRHNLNTTSDLIARIITMGGRVR